jgi:hypothetical protein
MRRRTHCVDTDPIRWLAAGIDPLYAMPSGRRSQSPKATSPIRLEPPPGTVPARPTSLSAAPRPIHGIRAKPKSP